VPPALARLTPPQPRRRAGGYAVAVVGTAALTIAFLPARADIAPLSQGFGYLVVVVFAAWVGGLLPGIVASIVASLSFNFFFLPPYDTFAVGRGEYVVVLFVFLGLSLLISWLLARWTERATAAEARENELKALQGLSAELVALLPGPEGYETVLAKLLALFAFSAGALFVRDESGELRERVTIGADPEELSPRAEPDPTPRPIERLPLAVGGRELGLLVLRGEREPVTPAEGRVLRAFCDQFALVLERDRLLRTATEAEVFRQSDRVRRSLLAAVSHDLRSPLAAIKASVTDLLDDDADRDPQVVREALSAIDNEADRLNALIANLLDMSRIEAGMLRAHLEGVDLTEALTTCADRIRHQYPQLDVDVGIDERAATVRSDPVFLDRVGTNLLENAAKASTAAGTTLIEVRAVGTGSTTTIRVIDHGQGVPHETREQLFYPFYRPNERNPRLGTGLGLAISKGFLDLMEGEIWIEETPGGGATFAFSLPTVREPEP
jgi:two-component system sensor histidine kinase KdpD